MLWLSHLSNTLDKLGFHKTHSDSCLFVNDNTTVFILVYVDDIKITGPNKTKALQLKQQLQKEYEIKEIDQETSSFLGLVIQQSDKSIHVSQTPYIYRILKDFGMADCNESSSPGSFTLSRRTEGTASLAEQRLYMLATSSLLYLATQTRPDLAFRVGCCCRYNQNPGKQHWEAVKRIFRYLRGTPTLGLLFQKQPKLTVQAYSDLDFAGCSDTRQSTSSTVIKLSGSPITWRSRLQLVVTLSSIKAEY